MDFAALGSFLSGVGAVLSAGIALRLVRRRAEEQCEKRFEAFREGLRMRRELE